MAVLVIADSYFDGHVHHSDGPYTIAIADGVISSIERGDATRAGGGLEHGTIVRAPFVMPGLVEAHCHLFLNGGELDFDKRKAHLAASRDELLATARENLADNVSAGITLIRDAGDIHGINLQIRQEIAAHGAPAPVLRCPGRALRKIKRYGSFMAIETNDSEDAIRAAVDELAPDADDLKILLTGIIDFENGTMKGGVQFDMAQTKLLVELAHERNLRTYAHCSGPEGLDIATQAGIDSIEHGFFMEKRFLEVMAAKQIAWVPTFSPVYLQYERPELAGWDKATVGKLWAILENHFGHLAMAQDMGVPIVAGSDAGSYGVVHGRALIDELVFHRRAGLSVDATLASATTTPRRLWGCPSADIQRGNVADMVTLAGSPYANFEHMRHPRDVVSGRHVLSCDQSRSCDAQT